MVSRSKTTFVRRRPRQRRARETFESVLDAVIRILKREGSGGMTTNHIAEVAGVSIGSVYQYFPDKRAIFTALHERHINQIDRLIHSTLVEHARSSLEAFKLRRGLVVRFFVAPFGSQAKNNQTISEY